MIHTFLELTRPLIVFDTETTGVDWQSDRIVELGFQVWTAEGMAKEWRSLINPGIPIPASATKVHNITDEMVSGCQRCGKPAQAHADVSLPLEEPSPYCSGFKAWPTFRQLAPYLVKGFCDCDYAGKNVRFDIRIFGAEMKRAGVPWNHVGARIIDAERLEQIAIPRSLSHLHEKYAGRPHDGAHGALSDVRASLTVIVRQLEVHDVALPRDLDALHQLQWPGWLDSEGAFRMIDGVPTCAFGKHKYKPMTKVPLDYYDYIIRNDFSEDIKQLARDAKLGKFPETKG